MILLSGRNCTDYERFTAADVRYIALKLIAETAAARGIYSGRST